MRLLDPDTTQISRIAQQPATGHSSDAEHGQSRNGLVTDDRLLMDTSDIEHWLPLYLLFPTAFSKVVFEINLRQLLLILDCGAGPVVRDQAGLVFVPACTLSQ